MTHLRFTIRVEYIVFPFSITVISNQYADTTLCREGGGGAFLFLPDETEVPIQYFDCVIPRVPILPYFFCLPVGIE